MSYLEITYLTLVPCPRYKDGVPILNSTCYESSEYSLTIREVKKRDEGVFTISLGNQEKGLYRNLSYTLEVDGKLPVYLSK